MDESEANKKGEGVKLELHWIGALETCDLCGDDYPMSWITYTGAQFLCAACVTEETK